MIEHEKRCVDFKQDITAPFIKIAAQAVAGKSEFIEQVCCDPKVSNINIITLLILLKTTDENQGNENLNKILLSTLSKASESKEIDTLIKETVTWLKVTSEDEGDAFREARTYAKSNFT